MDDQELQYQRAYVIVEKGMMEAQEWFYRDDLYPSERRKMAMRSVLRGINKAVDSTGIEAGDLLHNVYNISVGRKKKVRRYTWQQVIGPWYVTPELLNHEGVAHDLGTARRGRSRLRRHRR